MEAYKPSVTRSSVTWDAVRFSFKQPLNQKQDTCKHRTYTILHCAWTPHDSYHHENMLLTVKRASRPLLCNLDGKIIIFIITALVNTF